MIRRSFTVTNGGGAEGLLGFFKVKGFKLLRILK
jgi:hypothetical protein